MSHEHFTHAPMLCISRSLRDFDTFAWNVCISLPNSVPNLLSASLCHESYLRVTFACTFV